MRKAIVLFLTALFLLAAPCAQAERLIVAEGPLSLTVSEQAGGEAKTVSADHIDILASVDGQWFLVNLGTGKADDYYIARETIAEAFKGAVDPDAIPNLADLPYATLQKSAKGDNVQALQQALKTLGFLSGTADGSFGGGTSKAIVAFQESARTETEKDGVASPKTQALIFSAATPYTSENSRELTGLVAPPTAEEKFPSVAGKVPGVDWSAFTASRYQLAYDDIEGEGALTDKDLTFASELDGGTFTVAVKLTLLSVSGYGLALYPKLTIDYTGPQMPYAEQALVKIGENRYDVALTCLGRLATGSQVSESLSADLTGDGFQVLSDNAEAAGGMVIRVKGKFADYDISLPDAFAKALAELAKSCEAANLTAQPYMQASSESVVKR